jgi:hypothetical protein
MLRIPCICAEDSETKQWQPLPSTSALNTMHQKGLCSAFTPNHTHIDYDSHISGKSASSWKPNALRSHGYGATWGNSFITLIA